MNSSLWFVLRQTSKDAVFQHLALCSPTSQLMHWVLPGRAQQLLDGLPYYLLCESPTSAPLPHVEVDRGECRIAEAKQENLPAALHQCIEAGHLLLHLRGSNLTGAFTLTRRSPDSHIWRFSVGHYVPHAATLQQ
ncbi:hypothetical protein [Hymenobacter radiodurans]|uniref:hypothetical protein n=1 Tax=Hymenobacter radiodurans TaxID=2496028 RepID=UPI001058A9D6|nr:hypothetical protein [Hymenobacter radiodurans]